MHPVVQRCARHATACAKDRNTGHSLDPYIKGRIYGRLLANASFLKNFGLWFLRSPLLEPHLTGAALPRRCPALPPCGAAMVSFVLLEDRMAGTRCRGQAA